MQGSKIQKSQICFFPNPIFLLEYELYMLQTEEGIEEQLMKNYSLE